jgi:hypothetical protein
MTRSPDPYRRLAELRRQQSRLAELAAIACVGDHRAAQRRAARSRAAVSDTEAQLVETLQQGRSSLAYAAGIVTLDRAAEQFVLRQKEVTSAAARVADALQSLRTARQREELMERLSREHQRQLRIAAQQRQERELLDQTQAANRLLTEFPESSPVDAARTDAASERSRRGGDMS